MATKVSVTGNATLLAQKFITAKQMDQLMAPLVRKYKRKLERTATRHYQNIGSEIKSILRHGFPNPGAGGSRRIRSRDGEDKPVQYATRYWPELTKRYMDSYPKSSVMWNKFDVLYREVKRDMPKARLKVSARQVSGKTLVRNDKKSRRVTYALKFPVVGDKALGALMTKPFVYGDESVASGFKAYGLSRGSSDVIGYPEAARRLGRFTSFKKTFKRRDIGPVNRPWVAGLSGRLGREMHRKIRKL